MQDLQTSSTPRFEEVPDPTTTLLEGHSRNRFFADQILAIPRRLDLRHILTVVLPLVLLVFTHVGEFLTNIGDSGRLLGIHILYLIGLGSFVGIALWSISGYRYDFRRALRHSDIFSQLAARVVEAEMKGRGTSGLDERNFEAMVEQIAKDSKRFVPLRTFFFSRSWKWIYYALAITWWFWSDQLLNPHSFEQAPYPHLPLLEMFLPFICSSFLRRVRLEELCSYLRQMLLR